MSDEAEPKKRGRPGRAAKPEASAVEAKPKAEKRKAAPAKEAGRVELLQPNGVVEDQREERRARERLRRHPRVGVVAEVVPPRRL